MNKNINKKHKHGLAGVCIKFFVICIILILVVILVLDKLFMNVYQASFINMNDFIDANKQYLINEEYDKISLEKYKNVSFVIFDDDGDEVFTNDNKLEKNIVLNVNNKKIDYEKINYQVEKGDNDSYFILCNKELKNEDEIIDYGVIDKNRNIVKGNLFSKTKKVTNEEFTLIKELYSNNNRIERYNYKTKQGDGRKLFFLLRLENRDFKTDYLRIELIRSLIIIISVIIMIIIFSNIFKNKLLEYIKPLNNLISNYKQNGKISTANSEISEYQEIIDNFNELTLKLDESNKEKKALYEEGKRIITDISHDIKTPLTVILGYSKALNDNVIPEEKKEYYLNAIYNKAVYANDMIHEFINYSKMEHPDFEVNFEKINLNEYLRQYIINSYDELISNGYNVEIDIDEKENYVLLDTKLFKRVLVNLVNNFSKYNDEGTTLYFKIENVKGKIILYVGDNGKGIDEELKKKIFDPFVTSNEARVSKEGQGLGLSIVRKIIEKHRGTIVLESDSKWKTLFKIELLEVKG